MATTTQQQPPNAAEEPPKVKTQPTEEEKLTADKVLARVKGLLKDTGFSVPANYDVDSAVRLAFLDLQDMEMQVDNKYVLVLNHCTPKSIGEAVFKMIIQGLNPMKKQAYFIPRGNKLYMDRSYQGEVAVARRVAGVKKVNSRVIKQGDIYVTEIVDGELYVIKHEHNLIKDGNNEIIGAYAVAIFEDGTKIADEMTIDRIKKSWDMSKAKGDKNKLQNVFDDEACIRTVTRHLCKPLINQSDDSRQYATDRNILEQGFDPHEDVTEEEEKGKQLEQPKEEAKGLPPATVKMTVPQRNKEAEQVPAQAQAQAQQEPPATLFSEPPKNSDPTNTDDWK